MSDTARRDRIIAGACVECGGELSAGCEHCNGTGREPYNERWFYMSFVHKSRAKGDQFVGGCYIQAGSLPEAITKSHILGINPGGEIQTLEFLPEMMDEFNRIVPEADRHRLLTRAEIEAQG